MEEELEAAYRALVIGTRDYVRKCGFRKVVIGLSGGIDSALVAAIAADALGPANVTGVAMPGPYSSASSLHDAQRLAENLGIQLIVMPIVETFASYRKTLGPTFDRLSRRYLRREYTGAHSRQSADGPVEQIRLAGPQHRQ